MSERYGQTSDDGKVQAEYGYDNPLETFYLQVYNVEQRRIADEAAERVDAAFAAEYEPCEEDCRLADETGLILWVGTLAREIPTVERLAKLAAPFVTIPAEIIEQLRDDQRRAPGPTDLQRVLALSADDIEQYEVNALDGLPN